MSEDWIAALAHEAEVRYARASRSTREGGVGIFAEFGRAVAERVRLETLEELKAECDELRNLLKIAGQQLDALLQPEVRTSSTTGAAAQRLLTLQEP